MLNLLSLPKPDWELMDGNPMGGKYLICHGIEIRFYAAQEGSANMNLASVTDTTIEAALAKAPTLRMSLSISEASSPSISTQQPKQKARWV